MKVPSITLAQHALTGFVKRRSTEAALRRVVSAIQQSGQPIVFSSPDKTEPILPRTTRLENWHFSRGSRISNTQQSTLDVVAIAGEFTDGPLWIVEAADNIDKGGEVASLSRIAAQVSDLAQPHCDTPFGFCTLRQAELTGRDDDIFKLLIARTLRGLALQGADYGRRYQNGKQIAALLPTAGAWCDQQTGYYALEKAETKVLGLELQREYMRQNDHQLVHPVFLLGSRVYSNHLLPFGGGRLRAEVFLEIIGLYQTNRRSDFVLLVNDNGQKATHNCVIPIAAVKNFLLSSAADPVKVL